jgi:general secretion pathway protein J
VTLRHASGERGFTLLEILVAVTLLGLLMVGLLGGVRLGVRAWEAGRTRLDDDSQVARVQDFLRERLTQARLFEASAETTQLGLAFHGERDRLSFVSLMPEHLGVGPERMVLGLTQAGDGTDLRIEWWPADLGDSPDAAPDALHSRVLLSHLAEIRFAYFGQVETKHPPIWSDAWSEPSLPLLVRVQVRFPDQDARSWPDLIVRPMIDGRIH